VRSALKVLLEEVAGVKVSREAAESRELERYIEVDCPDIILVNWNLSGSTGPELIDNLKGRCPNRGIIVIAGSSEIEKQAMDRGVDGFICTGSQPQQVIATIIRCLDKKFPVYD
jgi:DNA-binding NarL/FixJ family response regulator